MQRPSRWRRTRATPGYGTRKAIFHRPHERAHGKFRLSAAITVCQAPMQSVRSTLMDRHGHLGRADTEALDRPRRATNKCNGPEIEMVSECDNSVLWRRFEIDRERVIAIWRFDRSHGGTCAISSHDPQRKMVPLPAYPRTRRR